MSVKLTAMIVQALSGCLGGVSFLALTARFSDSTVGAYASGAGAAGLLGAGFYVLLKDVFHRSSEETLTIGSFLPLFMVGVYWSVLYESNSFEPLFTEERLPKQSEKEIEEEADLTRWQYFAVLLRKYMIPLLLVFLTEFTINCGVLGTLPKFRDGKKHEPARTYNQLIFIYQRGAFLSRSSLSLFHFRQLYLLAILQAINLIAFIACSVYVLLPSLTVARLLVLYEGFLGDLLFVNISRIRREAPKHLKEWALATASCADTMSVGAASLICIWLEQALLGYQDE